jgi:DNA ligase-1
MKTLIHFKEFCDEMTLSASRKHKQEVLTKYKDDPVIQRYLQINFDPYTVFGISTKKLTKRVRPTDWFRAATIFELFDYLTTHNTGKDEDVAACQEMLFVASEVDPALESLLEELICKDLSIGADSKTINSIMPDLIPTFNVQLANKYFDKPEYVEGKEFAITTKIDGGRIIAIKENGQVSFFTRAGQRYEGLVDLEQELLNCNYDNFVFDGEITLFDYKDYNSKDAYKQAMKITRADGEKHGVKMLVFDFMYSSNFRLQECQVPYINRYSEMSAMFDMCDFTFFEKLPILYKGTDTSKITELLNSEIARGQEGVMINICDAPYEFKRTNSLLKVKKMNTLDLQIIGFEEGSGRLAGTLGAILVRYKNGNVVKVGSGFTDWLREEIWKNQGKYLDRICEIQYFEETTNADGGISLRFPIFKDFRTDKLEADF